ncbi:MAG: DUF1552 domain-containing protein [Bdellovibrionia bacterium]
MIYNKHSRRAFLQGAGGLLFSVPFLPSLAHAQAVTKNVKRLVSFYYNSGSARSVWFPQIPLSAMTTTGAGYRAARMTDIIASRGMISPIWNDPRFLRYASQVSMYRGLDLPSFTGHSKTGAFACYPAGDRTEDIIPPNASIDYLVSRKIYSTEPQNRITALGISDSSNNWNGPSASFASDSAGAVSVLPAILNPIIAFDHFFKDLVLGGTPEGLAKIQLRRKSVLDGVLEDYKRQMASTRLAASEKAALASHVEKFRELEKKITQARIGACSGLPAKPTLSMFRSRPDQIATGAFPNSADLPLVMDLMIEIAATALRCQITNVVTIMLDASNNNYTGLTDCHRLSHSRVSTDAAVRDNAHDQTRIIQSMYMTKVLNMVEQLDIDDPAAPGEKMLDNTLIIGSSEFGTCGNHRSWSMPAFNIGGGARVNTGWFVDYRSPNVIPSNYAETDVYAGQEPEYFGRDYNSWLMGVMLAAGLQPSDWEKGGVPGFGSYRFTKADWYTETNNPARGMITPGKRSPPPFMLKA